jgi:hypothetical protein
MEPTCCVRGQKPWVLPAGPVWRTADLFDKFCLETQHYDLYGTRNLLASPTNRAMSPELVLPLVGE